MFEITLEGAPRLDAIGRRLHVLTVRKLTQLTDIMYNKVVENVSGAILNKQSGQLAGSIKQQVSDYGDTYQGRVFVDPVTPKALVLEKGGDHAYPIYPTKGDVLKWVNSGGETVYAKSVFHPPSKEFAYLRIAAEEMQSIIPTEYQEAIYAALSGGAFE